MSATAASFSSATGASFVPAAIDPRVLLRQRMLATGYSPDDIAKVQSALVAARLHDTYLQAGYSPDDIAAFTSLY
jgi:hypothetical protein